MTAERELLEETVGELARVSRPSASPGEREAAEWLAARLEAEGCSVRLEEERVDGSEEWLQEGMRAFASRHFPELPPDRTCFLNLETLGSPHELALVEGEGPLRIEDYPEWFRDFVADVAAEAGVGLRRGLRSRFSTDSVVANRVGYPVATLVSLNRWKALANYHWPTDTPENVCHERIEEAVAVSEAVARRLAER